MIIRKPKVSGQFYPSNKDALKKQLSQLCPDEKNPILAKGIVMPHAGYMFSGPVAGSVISKIAPKSLYIIIGPNHTGYGAPFSLMQDGIWQTPLGDVQVDETFTKKLLEISKHIKADYEAHIDEHSIEVEIPFLQHKKNSFRIVPLIVAGAHLSTYKEIGKDIATCIQELSVDTTIIASSDFTHYEDHNSALKKDRIAIEAILALDEKRFLEAVKEYDISACGYGPIAVMITVVKLLGATKAQLVRYQTSGDLSGDYESVVGYAGILIT
ncbi:MAG: AmmeMemoRadiSam system protein B [Candidatus Omnitrophota bacterium]